MTRFCLPIPTQNIDRFFQDLARLSNKCLPIRLEDSTVAMVDIHGLGELIDQQASMTFFNSLLSPEERQIFSRFKYRKRRQEWLAGRVAAKYCLVNHFNLPQIKADSFAGLSITPDSSGAPKLVTQSSEISSQPTLSISHSHQYGVAMVCPYSRCGIDIQRKSEQLEKVRDKFVIPGEQEILPKGIDVLTRLTIIWAAKEAVKKSMLHDQPTLFSTIQLVGASFEKKEPWLLSCAIAPRLDRIITVGLLEWKDYIIASTTGAPSA